ncbi:retroviral-like aspartic protease family protein [Sphingosinicella sp. LY1275]|uniref:retroviral-like aspartic protease family protein n=1 Tax=Sphingosinicella sp. LY1275 TaxID=3095379 RepID=UPI002ADECBBD|nr:retroviral-like aspartic protease family protein [Sphingosinicella sp. LY1275]MEA1015218.1 retroviral-like aspartic protease family protein [Sphingosinicella sp. LY1275]
MPIRRWLIVALGLTFAALAGDGASMAQAPKIQKPRPVPPTEMPPLPPALIDDALAIGGEDINARKVNTRMTVEVRVNGRGPYRFLVDSGADTSVIGLRIARELQLPAGTPVILHGMTGSAEVGRVLVDELSLGQSTIKNLQLPALRELDLGGEGMIGIDALVEQRLMMDFEKRLIKAEDARVPPPKLLPGDIVVTARRRRGQLILTQVSAAGLSLEAVIDTGSEITIGNLALRDKLMRRHRDKFVTIAVTGVTGATIDLQLARIGELRVGSITLRDVPMAFADAPPFTVFGLAKEPALLLGTDLLETFRRVSLDFRARKVRFQLRRCGSTGIVISTQPSSSLTRVSSGDNKDVCRR